MLLFSYGFGVKGSEQKRVCDGYIGQGTVLGSAEHADRLHDASKGAEGRAVATSHAEAAAVLCVVCSGQTRQTATRTVRLARGLRILCPQKSRKAKEASMPSALCSIAFATRSQA